MNNHAVGEAHNEAIDAYVYDVLSATKQPE
jgi:hypothetical protein